MLSFNQSCTLHGASTGERMGCGNPREYQLCSRLGNHIRMPIYCYRHGRVIISYSCIYFGNSKLKTIKHHVTTVHQEKIQCLFNLQPIQNRYQSIFTGTFVKKNYVRRRDITIVVQKGLLTHGTEQLLLFVLLMLPSFENELFVALY